MHELIGIFVLMKILSIILSLYILILSAKECSDISLLSDFQVIIEQGTDNTQKKENHDSCAFTCVCNCCGMAITFQELSTFLNTSPINVKITSLIIFYQTIYRFDNLFNIWQPPKKASYMKTY